MRSQVEAESRLNHLILSNMLDFIARFFIGVLVIVIGAISLIFITPIAPIALIALFGSAIIALIGIIIDLIDGLVR